jgi:dihydropteroate synthase
MLPLIAAAGCPYVLMHSRGTSQTMDDRAVYGDVVDDVREELEAATQQALAAGVRSEQILWDPGLGFAKTSEQNLELLRRLGELASAGFPLLVGPSRKRFIGAVLNEPRPRARLWGTATVCALAAAAGASSATRSACKRSNSSPCRTCTACIPSALPKALPVTVTCCKRSGFAKGMFWACE